mmetsp:Transcript_34241/g.55280  ORF Transcript_34241/g.55280 Transcript_34241/m.55280 type:complete len:95 (+) Transcript_34241:190-474(+)
MCCIMLHCVAVYSSVSQCVAVCRNVSMKLVCILSSICWVALSPPDNPHLYSVLKCVAACWSVLQCRHTLQHTATILDSAVCQSEVATTPGGTLD